MSEKTTVQPVVRRGLHDVTPGSPLTLRQIDVITRVSAGEEHASIAASYGLTRASVSTEMRRIVLKLGAQNSAHAIRLWAEQQCPPTS